VRQTIRILAQLDYVGEYSGRCVLSRGNRLPRSSPDERNWAGRKQPVPRPAIVVTYKVFYQVSGDLQARCDLRHDTPGRTGHARGFGRDNLVGYDYCRSRHMAASSQPIALIGRAPGQSVAAGTERIVHEYSADVVQLSENSDRLAHRLHALVWYVQQVGATVCTTIKRASEPSTRSRFSRSALPFEECCDFSPPRASSGVCEDPVVARCAGSRLADALDARLQREIRWEVLEVCFLLAVSFVEVGQRFGSAHVTRDLGRLIVAKP